MGFSMITQVIETEIAYLLVLHLPQVHLRSLPANSRSPFWLEDVNVQLGRSLSSLKLSHDHAGKL
jgi:hypothetical protein